MHARWTRLAAVALVLVAAGPLLMLGAGIGFGLSIGDELAFLVITAGIALAGALLVWRFGTWAKVVGILCAAAVAVMLFWTAFAVVVPASFFDFVPGFLVIPGAILTIVSCLAAIVAGRRGHRARRADDRERASVVAVLVIVVLAAGASALATLAAQAGERGPADATVVMRDFEFTESVYDVASGTRFGIRNDDPFMHTFTVDALDVDVTVTPGSRKVVRVSGQPGEYVLYCRPHTGTPADPGEGDMAATLRLT